jgi:hypothetical protein
MHIYYWLDDNPERAADAANMEAALEVEIKFQNLKKANLDEVLTDLVTKSEQPTLIILDQNLENANRGIFVKGSTVAAFLRESWAACPIICITGEDVHNLNGQQKAQYEEVFPASKVSDYYVIIKSIALGFEQIKSNWPKTPNDVIKFLDGPGIDFDKLATILPTDLKESLEDSSSIVEISKWVRGVLMKRPGFLYDQLWLATLLGIKYSSFSKIEDLFEGAKYAGVFATDGKPRWWKSSALEILYDLSELPGLPWEKGRGIKGITEDDYSLCYYSGEHFPETVAYTDQSSDQTEEPMKLKYTELHPDYERLLYFDDIRLMKGE